MSKVYLSGCRKSRLFLTFVLGRLHRLLLAASGPVKIDGSTPHQKVKHSKYLCCPAALQTGKKGGAEGGAAPPAGTQCEG